MADSPKARVYDSSGKQTGEMSLDAAIFGIEPNTSVMHQVVTARLAALRSGTASTKTRGEVRGGGRKPWRQKGTGRARQGSTRSPQWKGGGVVFGPKPRSYAQRTPRKMRRLALASALSDRAASGEVRVVSSYSWDKPHTKSVVDMLDKMGVAGKVLFVLGRADEIAERSVRNLPHAIILPPDQLNAYDVLWAETIVFTSATVTGIGAGKFAVAKDDFVIEDEGGAA
ncbi:MAG: 50S ribosomal protein L4 [Actinomycetota bacterium]